MNEKQKELLYEMARVYLELAEECMNDDNFHQKMVDNNDLFPMSLDEMGAEWFSVAEGKSRNRID